jgi:hypothetical protein
MVETDGTIDALVEDRAAQKSRARAIHINQASGNLSEAMRGHPDENAIFVLCPWDDIR